MRAPTKAKGVFCLAWWPACPVGRPKGEGPEEVDASLKQVLGHLVNALRLHILHGGMLGEAALCSCSRALEEVSAQKRGLSACQPGSLHVQWGNQRSTRRW